MKCDKCGSELPEQPQKTIVIQGTEYETQTHDFNKILSEIQIPEGWRLWKASDFEKLSLADWDTLNLKDAWFFIKYPFTYNPKNYVTGFVADSVRACLSCYGDADVRFSALGVRFCRDIKKKVKQ